MLITDLKMSQSQVRLTIQQEIFQPNDERLLSLCIVGKLLKKKKSFLCIVTTNTYPSELSIVQVKNTDKAYKKKRSWSLSELKVVDGKSEQTDMTEFDLHLDKVYRWEANTIAERQLFIITLWKQACRHISKDNMPIFKNVPKMWVTEDVMTPESKYTSSPMMELENDLSEDFQAITDKEQEDLTKYDT